MAAAAPPPNRPIKILMLHGFTQSGPLFQAKTGALRKALAKAFPNGIDLVYPTGPIRLTPADYAFTSSSQLDSQTESGTQQQEALDAWAWWRRKTSPDGPYVFDGLDQGLAHIASVLRAQGPFDGVIGFSQGAAAATMLASLLEPNRRAAFDAHHAAGTGIPFPACFEDGIHPPMKFAVSYSGFAAVAPAGDADASAPYAAFYEPKIATPVLHFLGMQDVVIEEARSLALVERCERRDERYVVYHPGGHFLPSTQKASVNALIGFIREVLWEQEGGKDEEEDGLEDVMGYFDQPGRGQDAKQHL